MKVRMQQVVFTVDYQIVLLFPYSGTLHFSLTLRVLILRFSKLFQKSAL